MTTSINEKPSDKERKDIWVELQVLRQDTQALRTEVYRLRTAGRLDATANERLRMQQTEIERRGEAIVKRCVHSLCHCFRPRLRKDTDFRPNSNGRPDEDQVRNQYSSLLNGIDNAFLPIVSQAVDDSRKS
jgi:hypothetical protein